MAVALHTKKVKTWAKALLAVVCDTNSDAVRGMHVSNVGPDFSMTSENPVKQARSQQTTTLFPSSSEHTCSFVFELPETNADEYEFEFQENLEKALVCAPDQMRGAQVCIDDSPIFDDTSSTGQCSPL